MTTSNVLNNNLLKEPKKADLYHNDTESLGLSDDAKKVAKTELREDEYTRGQCMEQLRNWIKKNEDIENVHLNSNFLLRFLRVKKFSVPMAQQLLLKYLNLRKTFPHMVCSLDYMSAAQTDILNKGYMFVSPVRDNRNRRVIILNLGKFDPKKYSSAEMAKAHFILYETLLTDPETQVHGIVHVVDVTGMGSGHVTIWDPVEYPRILKWGQQSLPVRFKEIYVVNLPSTLKWVLDIVKGRMSAKVKGRVHTISALKQLYKHVQPNILPQELGGSIPMNKMIDLWKKELANKRELLLELDDMKILNDRGIIKRHDHNGNNSQLYSVAGSFRKLEVD